MAVELFRERHGKVDLAKWFSQIKANFLFFCLDDFLWEISREGTTYATINILKSHLSSARLEYVGDACISLTSATNSSGLDEGPGTGSS